MFKINTNLFYYPSDLNYRIEKIDNLFYSYQKKFFIWVKIEKNGFDKLYQAIEFINNKKKTFK